MYLGCATIVAQHEKTLAVARSSQPMGLGLMTPALNVRWKAVKNYGAQGAWYFGSWSQAQCQKQLKAYNTASHHPANVGAFVGITKKKQVVRNGVIIQVAVVLKKELSMP